MTPKSSFMIVAKIRAGQTEPLRQLLAAMNYGPGVVDPDNVLIPFGQFDNLHFARLVVLRDRTAGDVAKHGVVPTEYADSLAFFGDCDGSGRELLESLVAQAESGLRRIFSFCEQFGAGTDLLAWMRVRQVSPAVSYVNWIGRSARQIREEQVLRTFLVGRLSDGDLKGKTPRQIHSRLRELVCEARLMPGPLPHLSISWHIENFLHLIGVPLLLLIASPFLLVITRRLSLSCYDG